jgi:predicted dehydrogenase
MFHMCVGFISPASGIVRRLPGVSLLVLLVAISFDLGVAQSEELLRVGIIGCDTSHVTEFTKILNAPTTSGPLANIRVVAAYPGGSEDIPSSHERVAEYVDQLRGMGIEIVDSIDSLVERVDAVLLESVDGRPHLAQVRPVFAAKKPVFIDKPVAASLVDAVEIFELAKQSGTHCFSSSGLRYSPAVSAGQDRQVIGDVLGCAAFSPCELEPHHADLFWYGIHGVETLFAIMGTGCEQVVRVQTEGTDVVVGTWKDGRIGTFRGTRTGPHSYGATTYGSKKAGFAAGFAGYDPLVTEIAQFFRTGVPPVSAAETLEIYAFMEAAHESQRQQGKPVALSSVLAKAREEISKRKAATTR